MEMSIVLYSPSAVQSKFISMIVSGDQNYPGPLITWIGLIPAQTKVIPMFQGVLSTKYICTQFFMQFWIFQTGPLIIRHFLIIIFRGHLNNNLPRKGIFHLQRIFLTIIFPSWHNEASFESPIPHCIFCTTAKNISKTCILNKMAFEQLYFRQPTTGWWITTCDIKSFVFCHHWYSRFFIWGYKQYKTLQTV